MIASFRLYALLILHKKLLFRRSLKHEWSKIQLEEKVLKSASYFDFMIELKRQKRKNLIFKSFFIINLRPFTSTLRGGAGVVVDELGCGFEYGLEYGLEYGSGYGPDYDLELISAVVLRMLARGKPEGSP
ncbi:hypothetical protein ACU8KH_00703 [Lachancea thermotolerans]